jgi:glutamate N-acetyltransferase/amino-acid N-acetyltransferase
MPAIAGVTPRVARAGYKDWGRCDLTYVELAEGTAVAGVFTRNVCCSSEVELGRANRGAGPRPGAGGQRRQFQRLYRLSRARGGRAIMAQVAGHLGCAQEQVFVSSTGVIGVPLPKDKAKAGPRGGASPPRHLQHGKMPPTPSAPPIPSPRARWRLPWLAARP